MLRRSLVVLGIGAVVVGLAPVTLAQTATPSRANDNSVTLSGESLQIESRTISDFQNFFDDGTPQVTQPNSATSVGRLTRSESSLSIGEDLGIDEQVDVVVGDTLNGSATPATFRSGELDNERVRVQLQLGQ
jgi:hypothetical protein